MSAVPRMIDVAGVPTRVAEAGSGTGAPLVLIPPGIFGLGTLAGLVRPTLRLWDPVVPALAASRRIVALDTLGQGGTGAGPGEASFGAALDHLAAALEALGLARAHLVGHDEGALLAIRLALRDPARVASVTLVSAPSVAPTGDGLDPLTLANPLGPRLSARGQRWALERVSFTGHHVTEDLVADAVAAAPPATQGPVAKTMARAKGDTFADLRDAGLPVPAAVVWGLNDPVAPPAHGRELLELIARRQRVAQLHLVNRAGYFAYREQPALCAALVDGFLRGIDA